MEGDKNRRERQAELLNKNGEINELLLLGRARRLLDSFNDVRTTSIRLYRQQMQKVLKAELRNSLQPDIVLDDYKLNLPDLESLPPVPKIQLNTDEVDNLIDEYDRTERAMAFL